MDASLLGLPETVSQLSETVNQLSDAVRRLTLQLNGVAYIVNGLLDQTEGSGSLAQAIPNLFAGRNDLDLSKQARLVVWKEISFLDALISQGRSSLQSDSGRNGNRRGRIFLTHHREGSMLRFARDMRHAWWNTLQTALEDGWEIVHLISRGTPKDASRPHMLVWALTHLLGFMGDYTPRYFDMDLARLYMPDHADDPRGFPEFIVAIGAGSHNVSALELFSSIQSPYLDRCEVYEGGERAAALKEYVETLAELSESVLKSYPRSSQQFAQAIAETEKAGGRRVLFMRGLSQASIPIEIHEVRAGQVKDRVWAQQIYRALKERDETLKKQLTAGVSIREICTKEAIKAYLETGIHSYDDLFLRTQNSRRRAPLLSPAQREAHLTHIIGRLRAKNSSYELALVEEAELRALDLDLAPWWMVKEDHSVLIESWDRNTSEPLSTPEVDLEITDEFLVAAFMEFFQAEIWDKLPFESKDRDSVVRWLEEQIPQISMHP
jgi:hypothetical protein